MPAWSRVGVSLGLVFQQLHPRAPQGCQADATNPLSERPFPMGLVHCPLCVGLAIVSLVRGGAMGVLLWRLCTRESQPRLLLNAA